MSVPSGLWDGIMRSTVRFSRSRVAGSLAAARWWARSIAVRVPPTSVEWIE